MPAGQGGGRTLTHNSTKAPSWLRFRCQCYRCEFNELPIITTPTQHLQSTAQRSKTRPRNTQFSQPMRRKNRQSPRRALTIYIHSIWRALPAAVHRKYRGPPRRTTLSTTNFAEVTTRHRYFSNNVTNSFKLFSRAISKGVFPLLVFNA